MSDSTNGSDVLGVKDWLITLIVLAIPLVNIIMVLVWAFSSSGNANRRNFCRAALILWVIAIVLSIGLMVLGGGAALMMMDPNTMQMQPTP